MGNEAEARLAARPGPPPIISAEALGQAFASELDLILLDARGRAGYDAGHLIGARHVDPQRHLSSASAPGADPMTGGRHPLPDAGVWRVTLGMLGVSPASLVVTCDDQSGANAAARAWWMLRGVGHRRVCVLDGGIPAARDAGFPVTDAVPAFESGPPYPGRGWNGRTVDIDAVDRLRADARWTVLDVRSRERFAGEAEPIDPVAGHIPGAVNLPFSENLLDGRFKSPEGLRAIYERLLGGRRSDHLIVHCGFGVTACHTLLALEHAGLPGAALYVGSWSEWCRSRRAGTS
ncbi:MAG TPA: sulfurtransferase [Thermoanaerobaculia bacterium]